MWGRVVYNPSPEADGFAATNVLDICLGPGYKTGGPYPSLSSLRIVFLMRRIRDAMHIINCSTSIMSSTVTGYFWLSALLSLFPWAPWVHNRKGFIRKCTHPLYLMLPVILNLYADIYLYKFIKFSLISSYLLPWQSILLLYSAKIK